MMMKEVLWKKEIISKKRSFLMLGSEDEVRQSGNKKIRENPEYFYS